MSFTQLDHTGKKYWYLTATRKIGRIRRQTLWEFQCECGKILQSTTNTVRSGHTKSCGCKKSELVSAFHSLPLNEATANGAYRLHIGSAKRRGIVSFLTREQYGEIIQKPCHYCGDISLRKNTYRNMSFPMNSVDRLNNEPYYKLENSVPACFTCQRAKNALTEQEFYSHVAKIFQQVRQRWP